MTRIRAAIAVAEESVVSEAVVVRALFALDGRRGVYGEGHLGQDGGLENTRRSDQEDSGALEVESAFEDGTRDGSFAEAAALLGEELERAEPDRGVEVGGHSPGD